MKKTFLFLFLLFFFIYINAQVIKDPVTDQTEITGQPANDSLSLIEKVYVHTDRNYYFPGEDIWFKAYLIDAFDHLLTNHSNNLHVELISPYSKITDSRIIKLEAGLGNGDFKLPDSIRSGRYKIRAYTNYMRNFSDQLFFSREIIVINSADEKDKLREEVNYVENKIELSFFPEGGSLVDNVPSIIAFKAVNSLGKGCDVTGKIYSSNGRMITSFKSSHLGMGSFYLRPLPGISYYSVFRGSDSIDIRTELPKSFSDGITLGTSVNEDNNLLVTTRFSPQNFQQISDHDLLLKFSVRKEVIKTVLCKAKSAFTDFFIPTDDLPEGIVRLTLSTMDDKPLAERLVYILRENNVSLKIETDKLLYGKRDPVSLKISISGDSISEGESNVSLAAANKSLIDNTSVFPRNISSWFLLESDVRGSVEDPSYYFDPSNKNRLSDLDLLLRTQGWRDFAWKYNEVNFPPEKGFTVSGRLRKYSFNKAIENSRVSIGVFGNSSSFLTTVPVDSTGRYSLSGLDFTGDARLVVTGIGKKNREQGMLLLDSAIYIPANVSDSSLSVSKLIENKWITLKTYYEINESLRKKYKLSDTVTLGEVKIISERTRDPQTVLVERSRRLYDQPDAEVKVTQQMQSYPYLIEILRAHAAGVVVTGSYPDYSIIIRGLTSIHAQGMPLILIDGMSATYEDLLYTPIPSVERIDILKTVASSSVFGLRGSNGVINIITRAGEWAYVPVTYSSNIKIKGYDAARIFYSPQHSDDSKKAFNPDLRSTLLWEPNINLTGNNATVLKYFNGDNTSVIKVVAEGITSTGIPVSGTVEYEIK